MSTSKAEVDAVLNSILEKLADIEHQRWAEWQAYMFSKCHPSANEEGALVIPKNLVDQWQRKIDASYAELTNKEQESDREQVKRYLPILSEAFSTKG